MAATETLTLRLPPDLKRYVEKIAHDSGKSQNEVVVNALVLDRDLFEGKVEVYGGDPKDAQTDR